MNVPISAILSNTPAWVFVLFAYVIWRAGLQLRSRTVPLAKVWIMPGLFIAWGAWGLIESGPSGTSLAYWGAGALLVGPLGLLIRPKMEADQARGLVRRPGSLLPLLRVLLIFGAHYVLRVAAVLHSSHRDAYLDWDRFVSGAAAGYFLCWGIRFVISWRRAPQTELTLKRASA